jgi:hypothetical protein
MWRDGQVAYWREHQNDPDFHNIFGLPRIFLPYVHLYGDPSLRLP